MLYLLGHIKWEKIVCNFQFRKLADYVQILFLTQYVTISGNAWLDAVYQLVIFTYFHAHTFCNFTVFLLFFASLQAILPPIQKQVQK